MEDIKQTVKQFILNEFLPGEDPANLTDSVDLVHQGIVDSLATLKLVGFLEQHFGIELQADDANPENLKTLPDIAALVERRLKNNR
jgi:acyl carrier protein